MNSVHEPGSRTMSKNRLRNNTESKWIENRPSAPSAQPKASPGAQAARPARPCRACCRAPRAPREPRALLPPACRARVHCAPHAAAACLPRARPLRSARCRVRLPHALPNAHACAPACACCAPVPPASALATRPTPPVRAPSACSCSHNTILYCDTLWPPAAILQYNAHCKTLNFFLQYNTVYCNMKTLKPATIQYLYCNTLQPSSPFKLQYNLNLAIQKFPFSQYKIGSRPSKFSAQIFFFVFHYK